MTSSDRQLLERAMREAFEADYFGTFSDCPAIERDGDGYKAAHVQSAWGIWQAAWTASRQKALEEAAKLCDSLCWALDHGGNKYFRAAHAEQCASAIRGLGGIKA